MSKKFNRPHTWRILGFSVVAAAWIIAGPAWLEKLGLRSEILIELLTYVPAIGVVFMLAKVRPGFIACERRAFKRLLGLK